MLVVGICFMEKFALERTKSSPRVVLDPSMNYFEISGMSRPENVLKFYDPIIKWIDIFCKESEAEMILNFRMTYFNTATSKMFLTIVHTLEKAYLNDKKVEVLWSYESGDDDMLEAGKEFKDLVKVPFNIQESKQDFLQ